MLRHVTESLSELGCFLRTSLNQNKTFVAFSSRLLVCEAIYMLGVGNMTKIIYHEMSNFISRLMIYIMI